MKIPALAVATCAAAVLASAAAVPPRERTEKCEGTFEILGFDVEATRISLKDESQQTLKIAVDERAVPGWRSSYRVGQKVTLACRAPQEEGRPIIVGMQIQIPK
jgi:hypothetical protein